MTTIQVVGISSNGSSTGVGTNVTVSVWGGGEGTGLSRNFCLVVTLAEVKGNTSRRRNMSSGVDADQGRRFI